MEAIPPRPISSAVRIFLLQSSPDGAVAGGFALGCSLSTGSGLVSFTTALGTSDVLTADQPCLFGDVEDLDRQ
jgi:hypothetical protein